MLKQLRANSNGEKQKKSLSQSLKDKCAKIFATQVPRENLIESQMAASFRLSTLLKQHLLCAHVSASSKLFGSSLSSVGWIYICSCWPRKVVHWIKYVNEQKLSFISDGDTKQRRCVESCLSQFLSKSKHFSPSNTEVLPITVPKWVGCVFYTKSCVQILRFGLWLCIVMQVTLCDFTPKSFLIGK